MTCVYDPEESGVELLADDVRGALHDITLLKAADLPTYLSELTEDFRWSVSVKSTIQAGEDLCQFAKRVNHFLHPDDE